MKHIPYTRPWIGLSFLVILVFIYGCGESAIPLEQEVLGVWHFNGCCGVPIELEHDLTLSIDGRTAGSYRIINDEMIELSIDGTKQQYYVDHDVRTKRLMMWRPCDSARCVIYSHQPVP